MKTLRPFLLSLLLFTILLNFTACADPGKQPRLASEPEISLYEKKDGTIKKIKLDEYVLGVVAGEMDPSWPSDALAAQAILARTFTLKKINEGGVKQHGADASTDEKEFQAYAPERINDNVRQAVKATRGMVATYQGSYINAWFHADAGGRTAASALEGLEYKAEPAPYVKSVEDPGWRLSPPENKSWRAEFPWSEVRVAVEKVSGQDPGSQPSAAIVSKGPSGRLTQVRVGSVTLGGPALRLALGSEQMRSTLVKRFVTEADRLVVEGSGFGHGVGLSQWGAKALAEQGYSPEKIISYFFKDIELTKAWP